jgi:hypothetical protein
MRQTIARKQRVAAASIGSCNTQPERTREKTSRNEERNQLTSETEVPRSTDCPSFEVAAALDGGSARGFSLFSVAAPNSVLMSRLSYYLLYWLSLSLAPSDFIMISNAVNDRCNMVAASAHWQSMGD